MLKNAVCWTALEARRFRDIFELMLLDATLAADPSTPSVWQIGELGLQIRQSGKVHVFVASQ